ncbi:hypothetical protein QBC42DRAFT_231690 [Cladorrhinum samala]|uniref:UBZ4-type domain-containing protein n=1 Tax=Cladorrhinum samala TaxID=585594 RepID=A0AAV9HFL4_9PEZI|nr:hypothetical protein QBC42DRAFT_231690 [Cladorrhinum samala]
MTRVPTTKQVVPGAQVNIVLKADQPTGRTVSGAVKDVLTRGDHHRGIKVRLVDGRIGRVQSMVGRDGSSSGTDPGVEVDPSAPVDAQPAGYGRMGRRPPRFVQDVRNDPYSPPAPETPVGLDAYIKPAKDKKRKGGKGSGGGGGATTSSETAAGTSFESANHALEGVAAQEDALTCPVCNDFRGDARAIQHHVASHFDD